MVAADNTPEKKSRTGDAKKTTAAKRKATTIRDTTPARIRTTDDPQREQAEQSAERERLVERIARLKRDIAAGERTRAGTAAALAKAERSLVETDRRLARLESQQRALTGRIVDLDRQRASTEDERSAVRASLARTHVETVLNVQQDPAHLYLTGGDPNRVMLDDLALDYAARVDQARMAALTGRAGDLQHQRQMVDAETKALAERAETQKASKATLVADQIAQRESLARISKQLDEQRRSASALAEDEKRLARVIDELQRAIARRAAEENARRVAQEAARRRAEERAARDKAPATATPRRPAARAEEPAVRVEAVPDAASGSGEFAQLRGRLRLPARGSLTARFGAPRGDGGASWKGVFIRTPAQAEVHAVAAGRVVFSDHLRGFGNLVIVDHGDQYLSIYGNNETILKHAGDAVKSGDVLSLSGDSGGDGETGLYFELRFRGKPFDPMGWVGGR